MFFIVSQNRSGKSGAYRSVCSLPGENASLIQKILSLNLIGNLLYRHIVQCIAHPSSLVTKNWKEFAEIEIWKMRPEKLDAEQPINLASTSVFDSFFSRKNIC